VAWGPGGPDAPEVHHTQEGLLNSPGQRYEEKDVVAEGAEDADAPDAAGHLLRQKSLMRKDSRAVMEKFHRGHLNTSTILFAMKLLSTGNKTMRIISMRHISMRHTSTRLC
jgi:hypothetical protein